MPLRKCPSLSFVLELKINDQAVNVCIYFNMLYLKAKIASITMVDSFINRTYSGNRRNWTKWFLPCYSHIWTNIIQQQRPHEIPLPSVLLTECCSFLLSVRYQSFNKVSRGLCDNWSDITVILRGPTVNFATLALTFSTRVSVTNSMIKTTFTAVHLWPLKTFHFCFRA